jgi:hypothetical protein
MFMQNVQFCLCINDLMLGLKREYANWNGRLLLMPLYDDDEEKIYVDWIASQPPHVANMKNNVI